MIIRPKPRPIDPHEEMYVQVVDTLTRPRTARQHLLRALSHAYWIVVILILAWCASQAVDRREPVDNVTQDLVGDAIAPGTDIRVRYHVVRHGVCETEISWAIYDGLSEVRSFGPVHYDAVGNIGPDTYIRPFPLPASAAPGSARLRVKLAWQCPGNFVQAIYPIVRVLPDLPFEISRREP